MGIVCHLILPAEYSPEMRGKVLSLGGQDGAENGNLPSDHFPVMVEVTYDAKK